MASTGLRKDEGIGLGVAIALHAAVLAALLFSPRKNDVVKPPQRIEVTISDEVAMTSTSPDPNSQAAPDKSPELGEPAPEAAPVPEAAPAPAPEPAPVAKPEPRPEPKPEPPKPQPKPQPVPRPVPKAPPRPVEKPAPRPTAKPAPKPAAKPAEKPAPPKKAPASPPRQSSPIDRIVSRPASKPATASPPRNAPAGNAGKTATPPKKAGSSAFDDAFKAGTPGAKAPAATGTPAAAIGAQARSALNAAIGRQLKPHWQAPQGAEAELLVTKVRFRLNRDGSLAGEPQAISTTGQTAANQAQVARHQEQAIRAVKLAAPFDLPDDLYEGWKVVTTNFDRRLSQ